MKPTSKCGFGGLLVLSLLLGAAWAEEPESRFRLHAEVREVTMQATVVDAHLRPVTTLGRESFAIAEDGHAQPLVSFRREDVPLALALVVDNSASMRDKRPSVAAAALHLVRSSNPQDEICVVNFNSAAFLDQEFTADPARLAMALTHVEAHGPTALYDATVAAATHLRRFAPREKQVILLITDGEDDASRYSLEQAVRAVAVDDGPMIYAIGILGRGRPAKQARRALRHLAETTGGAAYFPANLAEVETISQRIAGDLRRQYTLSYRPATLVDDNAFHRIEVTAHASGYRGLRVHTRRGYYATAGHRDSSPGPATP